MQAALLTIMRHTREKFLQPIFILSLGTSLLLERDNFWACEIFQLVGSLFAICFTLSCTIHVNSLSMNSELEPVEDEFAAENSMQRQAMVAHLEDTPLIGLSLSPDTSLTFCNRSVQNLTDTTNNTELLASLENENILATIREKIAEHANSSFSAEPLQLEVDFGHKGNKMV